MIRDITFYKKNNRWFVYLPEYIALGGTEAECEMVHGADTFLDILAEDNNYVTLSISDTKKFGHKLTQVEYDKFGATYICLNYKNSAYNHFVWLCPVTLSVFDKYPKFIYFKVIEKGICNSSEFEYAPVSTLKRIWHILKLTPRIFRKLLKKVV